MRTAHISPYRGEWYPECVSELEALLDGAWERSRARAPFPWPDGLGYVVPHAGPMYSGTVAAAAYRALEQLRPETVVVLAFPHRGGLKGVAAPDVDAIATPLGEVPVASFDGFPLVPEARLCDHSFEIQLPFLQRAVPGARIVPLYIGRMDGEARRAASDRLAAAWRPGTVFVASSDFTHYGRNFGYTPFPPNSAAPERLRELDFDCIRAAGSLCPDLFFEGVDARRATVCGTEPIALLIDVMRLLGGDRLYQATLDYQASGEIEGDYRHSVSYAALGYYRSAAFDLDTADREALLDAAAETLVSLRSAGRREPALARGSAALQMRRGAFVTLRQGDEMLGCLGNCSGRGPLAADVPELALAAALDDPRFRPAAEAVGPVDIEISVLTPFRRIRDRCTFQTGVHGAFLELRGHSALLLPQVAGEHGWGAEDFFQALGRKAGVGANAYRDSRARIEIFEAQVFSRERAA
jgi:AmmeMemoRadiSam system protein B/AmmeMemoRadiSam system protein A